MAADFPAMREKVFERYPMMRSTAFERRMLFERAAAPPVGGCDLVYLAIERDLDRPEFLNGWATDRALSPRAASVRCTAAAAGSMPRSLETR